MIANPVNLFAEYAALNSGFCTVEPGGYFSYLTNSGSDPLTLCVSSDGISFSTQVLSVNEPIVSVGTPNPFIDFSGAACGGGAFGGTFVVFTYNLPAADGCIAQSKAFTVWLVNNQVSFSRNDEACVFELSAVNPSDGSEIIPDYLMPTGFITAQALYNTQVEARDIDGCGGAGIIVNTGSYLGTSQADFQAAQVLRGPYVQHSIETGTLTSDGVPVGGKINRIKLGGVGMLTINLTRNVGQSIGSYRLAVRNNIKTTLDSLLGVGCHQVAVSGSGNFQVKISMTCANGASPWAGIDKTDGFLEWCPTGTCPAPDAYNTTTVVTQTQAGAFSKEITGVYTTPCGEALKCKVETCPTAVTSPIYVLASCNYNNLTLDPATIGGNRYYVFDDFETSFRQAICHTVEVTISGTGCSTPPGPAVYSWQGGGANPKEFDPLQQDTAESDCGGCISPGLEFCYPEARRTGHNVILNESLACATGSSTTLTQLISPDIEDCDGNDGYSMTLSSLTVHDVPAAFTSCTPIAALNTIQSVHPANILPRTYYYTYRFREGVEQRSNYQLVRVNIVPGSCCPA